MSITNSRSLLKLMHTHTQIVNTNISLEKDDFFEAAHWIERSEVFFTLRALYRVLQMN